MISRSSRPAAPEQAWNRFAEKDPFTYILTSLKNSDPGAFWQSGCETVRAELLPFIHNQAISRGIGMELGCGVGRLIFPLAPHFQEIWGVDIAEAMVKRARSFALDRDIRNVRFSAVSGPDDLLNS